MKKYILLGILAFPLILFSCVDNSDEPEKPIDPDPLPEYKLATVDNIIGKWEVYYSSKTLRKTVNNSGTVVREIGFDGFTVYVKDLGTYPGPDGTPTQGAVYEERNAKNDRTSWGHIFSVAGSDSLKFVGSVQNGSRLTPDTTIMILPMMSTDSKFMLFTEKYYRISEHEYFEVTDRRRYRNMETAAGEHPGVDKINVSKDYVTGKWKIIDFRYKIDEGMTIKPDSIVGSTYTFDTNGSYTSTNSDGRPSLGGTYRIVDDVIHLFFKEKNKNEEIVDASSSINVTDNDLGTPGVSSFLDETKVYDFISGYLRVTTKYTTFKKE